MLRRSGAAVVLGLMCALCPGVARAGDLEVTIAVADGKSIQSGMLIADSQSLPLTGAGKMKISGLADKRIAVTVDALVGKDEGLRYLGVTEVKTLRGKTLPVKVTLNPVADVDAFCRGCHPQRGEPIKPGQIVRDAHASGKPMRDHYLGQVEIHNAAIALKRKEQAKDAPLPILLEKRVVQAGGKDVVKDFFTCESCHTTHATTPWQNRLRAPINNSMLCVGCHP